MLPKPGAALLLITCLLGCHQRHEKSGAVGVVQSVSSLMADANKGSLPVKDRLDAARKADSLTAAINDDVRHLESHKAVARLYLGLDSDRLAKTYLLETAELARRLSDNTAMGKAVNNIGIIYDRKGLNDSALKYYLEANKIFYQNRDSLYAAKALVNIGTIYLNQSKLKEAFEVTLDAIKELQLLNAKKDLASAYLTMGNVLKISNSGQALHYHKMALQVFRDSSDSVGMAISLNNIGNVYRYRKEYAEAISNYQQSLAIKESKGSKKSIGIAADNIGQAFLELGDFGNAEAYFKRAIDIQTATGDDDNLLMSINRLSNLYLQINDLNRAESTALVAQNERPAASQLKQRMDNNWVLFEVYNRLGKDKAASGYARKAFELKDSLYNSDAAAAIARMEAEYETKKKDKELLHAKQMQVVQVKQNRTQRGLFALLAFAGLVAVYFWRKRKNYIFRQHTLEAQQEILEVRQEALIAQLNTHFIGNTMSVINGYIRDNEKEKASEYLTLFAQLIRRVLESSHEGMVTLKDDLEIVTSYIELYKIQFAPGTLSYSLQVDDSIKADVILIPPMILQVLVENSIIHGFAKSNGGMLKLYIEKGENIIKCVIEDNGSGYAKSGSVIKKAKTSLGIKLAERLIKVSGSNKEIPIKIETVFDSKATPWTQVTVGLPYSLNS